MLRILKYLIISIPTALAIILFAFLFWTWHVSALAMNILPDQINGEVELKSWSIIGPFELGSHLPTAADEKKDIGLGHDYLADLGIRETRVDRDHLHVLVLRTLFRRLFSYGNGQASAPSIRFVPDNSWFMDLDEIFGSKKMRIAYAATDIISKRPQQIAIIGGSADGMKCWLNGRLILATSVDEIRSLEKYANISLGEVNQGHNSLVCKVDRLNSDPDAGWGFHISVADMQTARNILDVVVHPILDGQLTTDNGSGTLLPTFDFFEKSVPAVFSLTDISNHIAYQANYQTNAGWFARLPQLTPGVYMCHLDIGAIRKSVPVFIGDIEAEQHSLASRLALKRALPSIVKIHTDAWLYRIAFLMGVEHKKPLDRMWQHKIVNAFSDLEHAVSDLDQGESEFLHRPGYHIRAYKSAVDDSIQYYGLHVPASPRPNAGYPLIISVASLDKPNRPFLESSRVSDAGNSIEEVDLFAENSGSIIVEPYGRGNGRGIPVQEKDFRDVIADVESYYRIDNKRLSLIGDCEGGREAIAFAEHYPSMVAAVAAATPVSLPERVTSKLSNTWNDDHDVLKSLQNLRNIPVYVQHGDHNDRHVPISQSRDLVERCTDVGSSCELDVVKDSYYSYSPSNEVLEMIKSVSDKRASPYPDQVAIRTTELKYGSSAWLTITGFERWGESASIDAKYDPSRGVLRVATHNVAAFDVTPSALPLPHLPNISVETNGHKDYLGLITQAGRIHIQVQGARADTASCPSGKTALVEGPIADVFSGPTLLVIGTQGNQDDRLADEAVLQSVQRAWQREFFTSIPSKTDMEVTDSEFRDHNVVIIGAPRDNSLWTKLKALPIRVTYRSIALGAQEYNGPQLTFEAVYPNPLNKNRYVVIIGRNGRGLWSLPDPRLWSLGGTYDYAVNGVEDRQTKYSHGIFDVCWNPQ